jgi:hypothetical protein
MSQQQQLPFEFVITADEILIRIDRRRNECDAHDTAVFVQNACDAVMRELSKEESSENSGSFVCFSDCSCQLDSDSVDSDLDTNAE